MLDRLSGLMPMPVSVTVKTIRDPVAGSCAETVWISSSTRPRSVNLTAFESRLYRIWRSRCLSVTRSAGTSGPVVIMKPSRFSSVSGPNTPRRSSISPASANRSGLMSIFPASTLVRSRMSLISRSRSEPDEWMTVAYSTCLSVRLPSGFCASRRASTSRLFSGVRSSWDMLARNCDLYRLAWSSCLARSSISCLACSISAFFVSMSRFCAASSAALSASSALDRCSSICRDWSSAVSRCDWSSRGWSGVGDLPVDVDADGLHELLEEVAVQLRERVSEAASMTPSAWPSKTIGTIITLTGERRRSRRRSWRTPGGPRPG